MKYMLLIYNNEQEWDGLTESQRQGIYGEFRQFRDQITKTGQYVSGSQLQPVSSATTVKVRQGKQLLTDGPFAETREQLGGYFLIQAKDLDEAVEIAGRIPAVRFGTVEVRPLVEMTVPV